MFSSCHFLKLQKFIVCLDIKQFTLLTGYVAQNRKNVLHDSNFINIVPIGFYSQNICVSGICLISLLKANFQDKSAQVRL